MRTKDPSINRTMWFFAIVYAVEGIGQAKSGADEKSDDGPQNYVRLH